MQRTKTLFFYKFILMTTYELQKTVAFYAVD